MNHTVWYGNFSLLHYKIYRKISTQSVQWFTWSLLFLAKRSIHIFKWCRHMWDNYERCGGRGQGNVDVRHRSKFDTRIISKCVGSKFQRSRSSRSWDRKTGCTRAAICQIQVWLSGCYVAPSCIKNQSNRSGGSWDTKRGVRTCARAAVGQILVVRYSRLYDAWQHTKFQTNRFGGSLDTKRGCARAHVQRWAKF